MVWIAAPHSGLALAPQVSAPAPFDVFHDLRWLLVYHPIVARVRRRGARCSSAFRTAVDRRLVPRRVARRRRTAADTRRSSGAAPRRPRSLALVLLPFAVLLFATAVFSLSWLFFVARAGARDAGRARAPRRGDADAGGATARRARASCPVLASVRRADRRGCGARRRPAVTLRARRGARRRRQRLVLAPRSCSAIAGPRTPRPRRRPFVARRARRGARARGRRHRDRVRGLDRGRVGADADSRSSPPTRPGRRCSS